MPLFSKFVDSDRTKDLKLANPRKVFEDILRQASGSAYTRELRYSIYYQIYAFYGVVDGVGTSTIVANTALGLAEAGLTVCVLDTSVLAPTQDVLLDTDVSVEGENLENKEVFDWFDMPYTRQSPLHISRRNKGISVLSFKGKKRGVVDFLSTNDSSTLVEIALSTLHSKFDIILIDCCHEMSAVNTACLQQAQQVIQVWNDSPVVLSNLESYLTNAITLSCPLDKMRYVVCNKLCSTAIGGLDEVIKRYKLRHIADSYFSEELYLKIVTGGTLFRVESRNDLVIAYTDFIIQIICHILNIGATQSEAKGTISSNDILDGKVDGTLTKKMLDESVNVEIDTDPMNSKKLKKSGRK